MKIVFLNVWGDEMRDELIPFIEDAIQDTAMFCFQEATDEMKDRLGGMLSNYKEIADYKYIADNNCFPQSMFIRKDIEIISSGNLLAEVASTGLAQYAEINIGNEHIYVCNVHGTARPDEKLDSPGRLIQSKVLIDFFSNKDYPTVIGGDFNISPNTKSITMFKEAGYRDLIEEFDIKTTRNHLAWDKYPDNKLYYSDYVFLDKRFELKKFAVIDNEVSDHLPIILEISLGNS